MFRYYNLLIRVLYISAFTIIALSIGCKRNDRNAIVMPAKEISSATNAFSYLPPVISVSPNNDTSTSIILTTADVARFDDKPEKKPYVNSVQIIDADQPWPPRWYTSTSVYTDSMYNQVTRNGEYRYDFVIDASINSGYFSFYKILSKQKLGTGQLSAPDFAGYILLNEKMEPVDTIKSNMKRSNMFFHDLRINTKGERMVDLKKDTYLDLRDYTNNAKDSAVHCNVDYIHILDSNDKTLFTWNPLYHLSPDLFNYKDAVKKKAFAANHSDMIEWTRLTSALWDYDGNILYAMKQIGIGKVSTDNGNVLWQINSADIPVVSGKDTLEWYSPHDLNLLWHTNATATYSLYSNGAAGAKPAGGVVFEMNKKTKKFKPVKYIWPKTIYLAHGQGNLNYYANNDYAIGYGFFELSDTNSTKNYRNVLEYKLSDGSEGVYQLPQWIYTYKAYLLKNWPRPPRPVIIKKREILIALGSFKNYTWYRLSGTNLGTANIVGTGDTFKPEKGGTYCVESEYGIGFSVSRIFKN